jgi:hypothetical protein
MPQRVKVMGGFFSQIEETDATWEMSAYKWGNSLKTDLRNREDEDAE